MKRTLTLILSALLVTGIAAADSPDIPAPGLTPDSPFYPVEKMSERLELAVAQAPMIGSEELEAKVRANHAAETLSEARVMAEKNRTEHVERLMHRYSENMNRSIESANDANRSELKKRLNNVTDNQNKALATMSKKVPEQARQGIEKAMENNRRNQAALKRGNMPGKGSHGSTGQKPGSERRPDNSLTGRATDPGVSGDKNNEDRKPSGNPETGDIQRKTGSEPDEENRENGNTGNSQKPDSSPGR